MDTNQNQDFSLEDIMKEFGGQEEQTTALDDTQVMEPVTGEVPQTTIIMEPVKTQEPTQEAVSGDTIIMKPLGGDTIAMKPLGGDTIAMEPVVSHGDPVESVTSDTIRLDPKQLPQGKVNDAQPIKEEQPEQEAFTEQWEPEYEQPMGEYVPPQPILFHPHSRLRELKRKLVAGPEKRYYEISEIGFGKLQLAIAVTLLVTLVSAGVSALHALNMVSPERTRLLVFGQLFLMLLAALPGSFQLVEGLTDLLKKRFTVNTLLVFTFIACCVDAAFCLSSMRVPCCAAFSLEMLMSLWGSYHKRSTEMGMMDTMRKATQLDKLAVAEDLYEGKTGLLRGQGQVEEFMDTYRTASGPEKVLNWYALSVLLAAVVLGVVAGVMHGVNAGVQVLAVSLLAGLPATSFITLTRPMAVLERQMHKLGAVLCGWQGVKGLRGKQVFPISHVDLFPVGAAKMNGVKFFGSREPDEIVAYCTALVVADGGGLAPLFTQVLDSRNGRHYHVEELCAYPGGIGGLVCDEPVLVGQLSFLQDMGVEMPEGIRVNQAVCVAIDGELCGLFAVTYEKTKYAAVGLTALCADRKIKTVLTNGDFMLTESFLRAKFGVNPKRLTVPDYEICQKLREKQLPEDAPALLMTTRDGLAPFACGAVGARALYTASILGLVLHMAGGILGLAAMAVLTVLGGMDLLTPENMFLYQLVWLIPGLLITMWTKTF